MQRVPAAWVVHEQRGHSRFDGQPATPVGHVVADAVLALARGVDVHQGRAVVVVQHLHGGPQEVPLHGRCAAHHEGVRVERGQQAQLLAVLRLAGMGRADPGEVGILAGEARRGGLSAGVGIGAGVEHQDLDRCRRGQDPRHRAESDVVAGPVAADGQHGGHQGQFVLGEVEPAEGGQFLVVDPRVVAAGQLEACGPDRLHQVDRARGQALEEALRQRLGVLEEAVHPGVGERVVGHGGRVDAGAARRVGDYGGGRALAGGSALQQVEVLLDLGQRGLQAPAAPRRKTVPCEFGGQPTGQVVEGGSLLTLPLLPQGVARCDHHAGTRHLAAAATAAVSTGDRIVVVAVEEEPLGVALGVDRVCSESGRGVGGLRQEFEPRFQPLLNDLCLVGGGQGVRAANVDALQATGALPRVDGHRVQAAAARHFAFQGVEERPGLGDREGSQNLDHRGVIAAQVRPRSRGHQAGHRLGYQIGERVLAATAVQLADPSRDAVDMLAHGPALRVVDLKHRDRGRDQRVYLVHRVRDRGVRASQGAFQATGAQTGVELRHCAAEQALVLARRGARRHEQAGTGHHRGATNRPVPERGAHDVVVVVRVEEVGRCASGARQADRQVYAAPRRAGQVCLDRPVGVRLVVDLAQRSQAVLDHGHVGRDDPAALGAELLVDLLVDLVA